MPQAPKTNSYLDQYNFRNNDDNNPFTYRQKITDLHSLSRTRSHLYNLLLPALYTHVPLIYDRHDRKLLQLLLRSISDNPSLTS